MEKSAIIGIGNVLQKDDGIGIKLLKYLESQYIFPEHVELVDGGTCGATLNTSIIDKKWLIILDAVSVPGSPGDVHTLKGNAFLNKPSNIKLSPHQVNFLDLLQLMKLEGYEPEEVDLVGVIPKDLDNGTEISDEVNASLEAAVEILLNILKEKGVVPKLRESPLQPDYWWL